MNQGIDPNLLCPICLELAKDAVQSECCGHLFCLNCSDKLNARFKECPCCKSNDFKTKQSKIARRMISSIKVQCPNACGIKLDFGDLDSHKKKCPQQLIKCIFCSTVFLRKQIALHTTNIHQQEAKKAILNMHLKKQQSKIPLNNLFIEQKRNRDGLIAQIGQTGKYYCGGKLIGKCGCCDGYCGKTNGENCDACMILDLERLNLAKGYLINSGGYICKFDKDHNSFYCGRSSQTKGIFGSVSRTICNGETVCSVCKILNNAITLGRYRNLY